MTVFWQDWESQPVRPGVRTRTTGSEAPGALTELGVFPESALLPVPDEMTTDTAASLACAGVTAWTALHCGGPVGPESKVLLLGTGGVSIFALQLAKSFGATAVITSSSDEKLERARELGADERSTTGKRLSGGRKRSSAPGAAWTWWWKPAAWARWVNRCKPWGLAARSACWERWAASALN